MTELERTTCDLEQLISTLEVSCDGFKKALNSFSVRRYRDTEWAVVINWGALICSSMEKLKFLKGEF